MAMTALCSSWFVERCRVVPGQTGRTFACVLEFECVIGVRCSIHVVVMHVTLIIYTHYNGNDGSALIFVYLLNVCNGWRDGPKPTARTFVLLCVLEVEGVSY